MLELHSSIVLSKALKAATTFAKASKRYVECENDEEDGKEWVEWP